MAVNDPFSRRQAPHTEHEFLEGQGFKRLPLNNPLKTLRRESKKRNLLEAVEFAGALPVRFRRLKGLRLIERPRYRDALHSHGLEALRVEWA